MERDSLLAHGAAYLLHDRLHACSDYHVTDVCTTCGSLLAPLTKPHASSAATAGMQLAGADGSRAAANARGDRVVCPICAESAAVGPGRPGAPNSSSSKSTTERVALPYVFKYLATELAAMNIMVSLEVA